MEEGSIPLTEEDLQAFCKDQVSPREESHANAAVQIALMRGVFPLISNPVCNPMCSYGIATENENVRLLKWLNAMREMSEKTLHSDHLSLSQDAATCANVTELSRALFEGDTGDTCLLADLTKEDHALLAAQPNELLDDQCRAYDIIDWHLQQYLCGKCPQQMRMIIPGEAGVGKSKTIQTITDDFVDRGVGHILVKAAYTGLAASIIDGKTLHHIAMLLLHGGKQSAKTMKALEAYWRDKHYLIIDEMSMVS